MALIPHVMISVYLVISHYKAWGPPYSAYVLCSQVPCLFKFGICRNIDSTQTHNWLDHRGRSTPAENTTTPNPLSAYWNTHYTWNTGKAGYCPLETYNPWPCHRKPCLAVEPSFSVSVSVSLLVEAPAPFHLALWDTEKSFITSAVSPKFLR